MRSVVARLAATAAACALPCFGCTTLLGGGAASPTVAEIDGEVVSEEDLDAFIKDQLFARETRGENPARVYELRRDHLGRLIEERVVFAAADERGTTPAQMIEDEIALRGEVSDAEVQAFFESNPEQVGDATFEQLAPRIRQHLDNLREREVVASLVDAADVSVVLVAPRADVAADGPSFGPDDARVTIIEFSDFQCPYCRRASPVLRKLSAKYPSDVRVVYRHLPLDNLHPRARASAEASACAADGGRFWEYHDHLFANPSKLGDEDLRRYAADVGLPSESFDECLRSGRHKDKVAQDAAAASEIGITGTPAFVVNGVVLFGLQPSSVFEQLIQEELDGS